MYKASMTTNESAAGRRWRMLVPLSLTTLRLALGPAALAWALAGGARLAFLFFLLAGLLSDIYDGVLARKLGVSTPLLRRYDSLTDVIFYLFITGAAWILERATICASAPWIAGLILSEALVIGISLARFGCLPATHSYLAKFYGLALFATFVTVLCVGGPTWLIPALSVTGLLANAEIIAILFYSKTAPVDVLSIWRMRGESRAPQDAGAVNG